MDGAAVESSREDSLDIMANEPEIEAIKETACADERASDTSDTALKCIDICKGNGVVSSLETSATTHDNNSTPTMPPYSHTNNDSFRGETVISQSDVNTAAAKSSDNRDMVATTPSNSKYNKQSLVNELDMKPPRPSKNSVDGVQMMYDEVLSFPPSESTSNRVSPVAVTIPLDDNWSTAGGATASRDPSEVGSSQHSASPRIHLSASSLSGEKRCSPDKSILDMLEDDDQSSKSDQDKEEGEAKPYSHVSAAHEILNSFIALNPSTERKDRFNAATPTALCSKTFAHLEDRFDDESRKTSAELNARYARKNSLHIITSNSLKNLEKLNSNTSCKSPKKGTTSPSSPSKGYDKKKLNERLKQRLAERNQKIRASNNGCSTSPGKLALDAQANLKTHKRPASCSGEYFPRDPLDNNNKVVFDTFLKYGISPNGAFPDTVTFDSEDNESQPLLGRRSFRKSSSETGVSPPTVRSNQVPPPHGIGILQPDGVVFDDALLLRLARQARYSRLRGEHSVAVASPTEVGTVERRFNTVKIHVYDLLQRDALVEVPYFNCNFPIGQCFKALNNAANCLGTGAYHVGVEVNGIEYAFGANNIMGMSGVFTCPPKHSPGYEYRETLDFGNIYTSRNTWIRIPKENALGRSISNALAASRDAFDEAELSKLNTSTMSTEEYTFRKIESFADGNAVIHSMAKEYMGTDYDLLRKNCCTFAHDVCIRLGVKEEDIPSWFHNAAKAGADAEDAITNAEQTVKHMFDCADMEGDPTDLVEGYNHGFEVIADLKRGSSKLKVVESLPVFRHATARQPLFDEDHSEFWETLSWTY